MSQYVLVENRQGAVWVTINRAQKKNAISNEMWTELRQIFERVAADSTARALVLRGDGPDFSTGGDLSNVDDVFERPAHERVELMRHIMATETTPMFLALSHVPQPVVCSIRGHIVGAAAQFALLADLVLASDTTRFWLPYVNIAQTICHGESYSLPRKVGLGKALQLVLVPEPFSAADAERYGIVNWITADRDLDSKTEEIVRKLLEAPPTSLTSTKALLRAPAAATAEEHFEREVQLMLKCVASDNFSEAIRAFKDKRKPRYSDH